MPTPFKFFIKYCGNWSQLTPWMIGRRYLDGSEELMYGRLMGGWNQAMEDVLSEIKASADVMSKLRELVKTWPVNSSERNSVEALLPELEQCPSCEDWKQNYLSANRRAAELEQQVYVEIRQERVRQDAKWGGPKHDDTHVDFEWNGYIEEHNRKAKYGDWRKRMIEVAALAIAAVESYDRVRATLNPSKE